MRRRAPVLLLLAVCAAGAAVVAAAAAADERTLAFTYNIRPTHAVVDVPPGSEACQRWFETTAPFGYVEPLIGTHARPGPELRTTVREFGSGRVLARGLLPAGAPDNRIARVRVQPTVPSGRSIEVCFRNAGPGDVAIFGGPHFEGPGNAYLDGRRGTGDMRLGFRRGEPRSALALVPDMFRRASLLRPDAVGPWTFWVLLALVAAGVPLLLAGALRSVAGEEPEPEART